MEPIITFRQTDTGIWSWYFYAGREKIGQAAITLSLSSTVRIETESVSWYSPFHIDTQVFPGVSRKVMDDRTGLEVFRIIFCEPGFYRLMGGEINLLAEYRDGSYLFGNPGQPVLAVTERIREWPWAPAGEPFFRTTVYEENVPENLMSAILAFPAVRF